jgi:XTP/dITP diphosphohydrolase
MMEKTTLVIATRNQGKTKEIRELLHDFPIEIKNLDDFGPIPEIIEDGQTFEDNAYKKSSMTARMLGLPALADDSGLCVDALGGSPGVHSARYAGPHATDADNCRKLLDALKGNPHRNAAFECVISLAVPTGAALTYAGRCEGIITEEPMGSGGFGYDPVFFYPPANKTFAQLDPEEKNRVSHRGKALAEVRQEGDKILKWIHLQMPVFENISCKE